ncbi:MAG: FAD-binding oxidoreductase, partial [Parvibaculaceae bacterium]|nr:FAD-binding oxidoreductase [Parvibaculaceae bacterium]
MSDDEKDLPQKARVVIIGGGVIGCSLAYHLTELGWTDVVVLERKQLTSGTTWHAAGLIAQLRATRNMTRLAKYSADLYGRLEAETGIATGYRQNGSISVALSDERLEEFQRNVSMARTFDVDAHMLTPDECLEKYPMLNPEGVTGGVWIPQDGQGDPTNITYALAKGARNRGAQVFEDTKVTAVTK